MRHDPRVRSKLRLAAACCLLLTGCKVVTKSDGDFGTTFHYQWWAWLAVVVAGILVVWLGVRLRKRAGWKGWGIAIVGLTVLLVVAPMLAEDRVFVNTLEFKFPRPGFMAGREEVDFATVASVRVRQEWTHGPNARQIKVLYFDQEAGEVVRFPLINGVNLEAAKPILAGVEQHGIPVNQPW